LKSLALPTEARQSSNINDLGEGLGKCRAVDRKRFSGASPKPPEQSREVLANRIRELACDVRRIGRGRRCDAESIAIDKDCIAVELGSLARRLERRAAQ
jgi:hypothetical protein